MEINTNKAIEFLLARGNLPILYWSKKDILNVPVDREIKNLQKFAARLRIMKSQHPNGGWCNKKFEGHPKWEKSYYIIDTLRNIFQLYNYGCSQEEEGIRKAVDFLYSTQTSEGDFRGAYLNEYSPTYHALILEILCLLGYYDDKRVQNGFRWLMRHKQDGGGWVIPYRTISKEEQKKRYNNKSKLGIKPIVSDKMQPFSHLVTGMVLRAMAASPNWRKKKEASKVGELLMTRFFKADKYEDRHGAHFWKELTSPFWATDILSCLDSLAQIGFKPDHKGVKPALNWILKKQNSNGYWEFRSKNYSIEDHLWITLAILRIMKRFDLFNP